MKNRLTRRDFGKLSVAAFGGVMAGAALTGCGGGKDDGKDKDGKKQAAAEKHICRGLNSCKSNGVGGKNDCAGLGSCSTVAKHDPGKNDCKGGCGVPLKGGMWTKARSTFETKMKAAGKTVGPAPK